MIRKITFFILTLCFGLSGAYAALKIINIGFVPMIESVPQLRVGFILALGAATLVLGIFITPWIIRGVVWVAVKLEQTLQKTPTQDLLIGSVGLIIGLIIANLLGSLLSDFGWIGKVFWFVSTGILGYLGLSVSVKKREDIWNAFANIPKFVGKDKQVKVESQQVSEKVIDTSVIIDGRIADLCTSGFIEGKLIVPPFVLEELRHIADSSDLLKRNRGRRGLDILNKMRKESGINVQIYENMQEPEEETNDEVDTKLVKLAKRLGAKIFTNDFNLNKVAELHGVKVLNINELANAVKPVVLPGEEMTAQVVKDGKEAGQGVAYLDDGTMIVIDEGKKYIGQTINLLVTSVLQTSAGRMIFAKPKNYNKKNSSSNAGEYVEVNMLG
ncbi:MAG: PIN/TRAM domain-containing protein [Clostridiales bacterium]|nr:PIN/TRAM domain-containing protein [Clostridiales bacterium]MCF8023636.1 PIN/TRAM domain-containing protein [Clostridiales bacterium]